LQAKEKNMRRSLFRLTTVVVILVGLAFWTCQSERDTHIYVAVSKYKDTLRYTAYQDWLQRVDPRIVLVDMYHLPLDSAMQLLANCSGLLMSGGADIHPAYYNQPEDTVLCEIDPYRDTVEMAVLQRATEMGLPIFGICRGLQVINVFYGGSLYPDIPERFSKEVSHRAEEGAPELTHPVSLVANTLISSLSGANISEVNTFHHQGIDRLADNLRATAHSPDKLIEAIEYSQPQGHPFMMAVQWHPERMAADHPLSAPLAEEFVKAIQACYKTQKKRNKPQ
jgi:putative glutamine amidotransferase